MSLATVSLVPALPVQQLNVDPRLGGRVEPIIQMNNNSISSTNSTPADKYTIKVLRSSDPQSGHLLHTHTNGVTGEDTIWMQYDKVGKQVLLPQSQRLSSPNHDITGRLDVSGDASILGNLYVAGSITPGPSSSFTNLTAVNLLNTNLTSLNANINSLIGVNANISNLTTVNLETQNFISNTLISNLTVDNLFAQDIVATNITCLNPIVDLQTSNLTALNLNLPNLLNADFLNSNGVGLIGAGTFTSVNVASANTSLTALTALDALACSGNAATATLAATATNALACSGNAATATLAATATNSLACSGNAATATLAATATNSVNIQRYDRVYYVSPAGSGNGNFSNPCNFQTALTLAKAYSVANPEAYQAIYMNVGSYGNGGTAPFVVDFSRLSIIGLSSNKGAVQIVEGLDYTTAAVFDANNENNLLENVSVFNQSQAGANPCINFEPSAKIYLTIRNSFIYQDTANAHAIDCNPSATTSRLYIDNCQIIANGNMEPLHIRKGQLWQLSRSSVTSRQAVAAFRVSNSGSVVGIDNTLFEADFATPSAFAVVKFDVAGNLIMTNCTVTGAAGNTDLTGVDITDNAGVLVANNNQIAVYGLGVTGKALNGTGAGSILYTNGNNALGVAAAGQNTAVAGLATVAQTVV